MDTTTQIVHFSISGDFITDICRTWWADENSPERAMKLLVECLPGMTESLAIQICTGKKKLVGVNNLEVVKDNAKKSPHGNPLLSLTEMLTKKKKTEEKLTEDVRDLEHEIVNGPEYMPSPRGLVRVSASFKKRVKNKTASKEELDAFYNRPEYPDAIDTMSVMVDKVVGRPVYKEEKEYKPEPPPPPDTEFAANCGWIDLAGNMYPCAYSQHRELAEQLMPEGGDLRLEKLGWVKVQHGDWGPGEISHYDFLWDFDKGLTQKQIDAMWGWCQKHNRKFPQELIDGSPSK